MKIALGAGILCFALLTSFNLTAQSKLSTADSILRFARMLDSFDRRAFSDSTTPLGNYTEENFKRKYDFYKQVSTSPSTFDRSRLSFPDQINIELLNYRVKDALDYYEFKEYLNPILSDNGFHTSIALRADGNYTNKKALENYLQSLKAFPAYADQQMDLIRKGIAIGISQPAIALKGYESTYDQHIVSKVDSSVFWRPFKTKPFSVSDADWTQLTLEARTVIQNSMIPEFKKIKAFFEQEYYPKTRKTLGVSAYPDGVKYYTEKAKHYTSTNITPEEIYNIGLREVARIQGEMENVLKQVGYKGTVKEFSNKLRNDPKFQPTSAEALLKEASFIAKKIDGQLPRLFGKLPRQSYGVFPVPEFLAPSYTTGRYSGAPISGNKAGSYWVNTYDLKSRTLYTLEALTLHEAVPGHHLQTSLAQELDSLPSFRRNLYINAFGEGWGLYAEYLGYELGLYKDPYSNFGRLTYEMWRACRLVIDVGIHLKGWTRDQAVNYLADHTALSLHEVNTEVNRYITWPGQALAYKIGEIKIKELRKRAEDQLKEKFDVRAFHDLILSQGTVTLDILDKMVDQYIARNK